ncbi:sulfotransferase-like domain-containing protein [Cyclobacterium xiamenense]|uniref:sulfotransferase-like domain-containing protein n=1 Tax=Cyclobacterium xiamenense TaxID=1297121 RepID=UPI0012B79DB3|nr:sulfotransferase family protein [Cyclobacterium xiamenense]
MSTSPAVKRLFLWSGPRNISTALMYSFSQRADAAVEDEPLYAHYLSRSLASPYHPGAATILEKMENDGQKVVQHMLSKSGKPLLFFKNMTHHLIDLDWSFMGQGMNILLTREPKAMLLSFSKIIEKPVMEDIGYAMQWRLLQYLKTNEFPFVVLEAKKFLQDPEGQLRKLCKTCGIDFDPNMMHWKAGPIPEDGVWANYWYASVHKSTGFQPYTEKSEPFPEHLRGLLSECEPIYRKLQVFSL